MVVNNLGEKIVLQFFLSTKFLLCRMEPRLRSGTLHQLPKVPPYGVPVVVARD